MCYPSGSFSSSSLPSSSSSDVEPRTHLAYSDPLRIAQTSSFPSQNLGLGISYCEIEPSTNYLAQYPPSEQYPADWAGQFVPTTLPLECSLNNISPATFYERSAGSDASASPLSYCGPQAMSASSSRGSALDYRAGPDATSTHAYNLWPNTPHSDADIIIKEDPDIDYQDRPYPEYAKPVSMPLFAPVAQHRTSGFLPKFEYPEDDTSDQTVVEHDVDSNLSAQHSTFPVGPVSPWATENGIPLDQEQLRVPPASGLECTICRTRFTRRSNCREHMRRHDPNARKSYPCENCGKSLGRKTDLKRHIDSVHRGLRKFKCDQCGARFSRQDTLNLQTCIRWMQTWPEIQ
ncbi:hypothetical protein BJX76DRAFT_361702 [Aspergillus varians]